MKKMYFVLLMLGLILTSCGGVGYTTDEKEALEQLEQIAEDEAEAHEAFLEDLRSWKEEKDKILKDYGGKEYKLMKKAKKGDDDALKALEKLRKLDIKVQLAYFDLEKDIERKELVWNISSNDIVALMEDDDDIEDWFEDTEKIWEKRRKAKNKFDKKARKIWDYERYENYGDVSYEATSEERAEGSVKQEEAYSEGYYDDNYYDQEVGDAGQDKAATMYDYYDGGDAVEEAMDAAAEDYDDWDYK